MKRHPLLMTANPFGGFTSLIQSALDGFEKAVAQATTDHQLYATEEGWVLVIDAPGVSKEDIELKFEDEALKIESDHEDFELKKKFVLGKDVDVESISAKLDSGILEIVLPKTNSVKQINIK